MRKIGLFILTVFLIFANVGCGKKETAAEIMQKVQQKGIESFEKSKVMELNIDGTFSVSAMGITLQPTFQMKMEMENITDLSDFKGYMQISADILNEEYLIEGWITEDTIYTEVDGILDSGEFDLTQMMNQKNALTKYLESQSVEDLYKGYTVENTKDGYVLKQELTEFDSVLNTIKMLSALGSADSIDQTSWEILQSLDIQSMTFTLNVSKDYVIENENLKLIMEMEVEGQKMNMELDLNFQYELFDDKIIEFPDFGRWDVGVQNASCVIEQAGLMKMDVDLSATNDEIDKMNMKIILDSSLFAGVDFTTLDEETKAQVQEAMLAQLGISEDTAGLTTTVEFTDTMIVNVAIDLKTASKEDLNKIGLDLDNTDMSFKRFLEDSESEGYTCTKN